MKSALRNITPGARPEWHLDDLKAAYGGLGGEDLLAAMITEVFSGRIALVSSFGAESAVLLDMVARIDPATPVIFLNTKKLFGETLRYRDLLTEQLGLLDVRSMEPDPEEVDRLDPDGMLWARDPDLCCDLRKVRPMARALEPFEAWITGRKRFQSDSRAALEAIEESAGQFKLNPLAAWTSEDLDRAVKARGLPAHPLVADGFLSLGCMPCTDRVAPGGNARDGRWAGLDKEECGIHGFEDGDGI